MLFADAGYKISIINLKCILKELGFNCLDDPAACATPYDDAAGAAAKWDVAGALRYSAEAAFRDAGALVFNETLDLLCAGGVCDHRVPGTDTVGIVDTNHFTTEGSLYLAPFLACWLERVGLL